MPKPARSRQRPVPRPPVLASDPAAPVSNSEAASPRTAPVRTARRVPGAGGAGYAPPDYSYVGRDVIRILLLSAVLVAVMVGISRLVA